MILNKRIVIIACLLFSVLLIYSLNEDYKIENVINNGKKIELLIIDKEKNICKTPRGINRHIDVVDLDGIHYKMLIRKSECLKCKNKIEGYYLNGICIHSEYKTYKIFKYFTFTIIIICIIVFITYLKKK
jgi:hypothetical protein